MTNISESFPFKLNIKTDPDAWEIVRYSPGFFERFLIKDSIFDFFPYCELVVMDNGSVFTEENFFTEFLKVKVKFSDPTEKDKLFHDYYLSEYQMNDPIDPQVIQGFVQYFMSSDFFKQDEVKNKSYYSEISTIVRRIMLTYKFPENIPKLNVTSTTNFDLWYQSQEYDFQFLKRLARYASKSDSPFFTFLNCKSEFYFQSVKDILSQNPEVKLYFGLDKSAGITAINKDIRNDVIQTYSFQALGAPNNSDDYNGTYYKLDPNGNYISEEIKIDEKLDANRVGLNKQTIRSQDLRKVRKIKYYGVVDNQSQNENYKGSVTNEYIDSVTFPYRLKVSILGNHKLASGKVVETFYKSPIDEKDNKAKEYSGKWAIIECIHAVDSEGQHATQLTLGKNSLSIYEKHKFYSDFI